MSEEDTNPPAMARTGRNGRFRLTPLAPGPYGVTATKIGLAGGFQGGISVKPGKAVTGTELRLDGGGHTFRGFVRDGRGAPVPRAQIRALRYSDFLGDVFYANADSSGGYAITLPSADYLLLVVAQGFDSDSRNVKGDQDRTADFALYPAAVPGPAPEAVVDWIRSNAIPLKTVEARHGLADMEPLRAVVGEARLVSLGEATHGTREFFQLKHRVLEFLVARMGFTVFGIEATMPEGFDVNDYVLNGRGDPAKALSGLYFWTWDTEEVLDLIHWMRSWNADPAHRRKVKFYGFDMQFSPRAARHVVDYLRVVDPVEAGTVATALAPIADPYRTQRFSRLPVERRLEMDSTLTLLLRRFDDRREEYIRHSGADAWAMARQHARVLGQYVALIGKEGPLSRDRSMAENIRWILEREGPDSKMVVWAHNAHVSKAEPGANANGMGFHLREAFGRGMVVFGFSFNRGSFQAVAGPGGGSRGLRPFQVGSAPDGSLDQTLERAGLKTAAIDLRRIPDRGPVADWFSRRQTTRSIGAVYSDSLAGRYFTKILPSHHFDAILFVDSTSTARATRQGQRPSMANQVKPSNLDFEEGVPGKPPPGWVPSSRLAGERYRADVTKDAPHSGARCVRIRTAPGRAYGETFGSLTQTVDAGPYREKRVRFRAWVRVRPARSGGRGHLWLRVSGPATEYFFDGMEEKPITSDGWQEYRLEGDVPKGASSVEYGIALVGEGAAWIDGVSFEEVER